MTDITDFNASELSERIHKRQVSCVDVMNAYLQRIDKLNPIFNAIVNIAPAEKLLVQPARAAAQRWPLAPARSQASKYECDSHKRRQASAFDLGIWRLC